MANLESVSDANVSEPTEAPKTNNLSEVATDLMSAHAHRPGLTQDDLAKATDALHANGALADLSIIGLDGKDLIARDGQGQTLLLDSNNPENQQVLAADMTSQAIGNNGRTADLAPDGSGKYTVVSGDSCWRVANDILTAQGVADPTDNQIANYIKELETTNGRSFAQLQVGDEIIIPTKIQGGESSHFAAPETTDNTDTTLPTDTSLPADASVPVLTPEAQQQMALEKTGIDDSYALMNRAYLSATGAGPVSNSSASYDDISNALNSSTITADQKLGLEMLQSQFDYIKNPEDGTIHPADLERAKTQRYQEIDSKFAQAAQASSEVAPGAADTPIAPVDSPELTKELNDTDIFYTALGAGYLKAVQHESPNGNYSSAFITQEDITSALTRPELSEDERFGLEKLGEHFDDFKNPDSGTISSSDLLKKRDEDMAAVRAIYAVPEGSVVPEVSADPALVLNPDVTADPALAPADLPTSMVVPDLSVPDGSVPNLSVPEVSFPDFNTSSIYEDQDLMAA